MLLYAFVEQQVGIADFLLLSLHHLRVIVHILVVSPLFLSAIGLVWNVPWVELLDNGVVELVPSLFLLFEGEFPVEDEGVVVPGVSDSHMYNDSVELVLEVGSGVLFFLLSHFALFLVLVLFAFPFAQSLLCELLHIEFSLEFAEVVDLNLLHCVKVELEAFEH